jgi:hypothetical protein
MRKLLCLLAFAFALAAHGQSTTVGATITDSDGNAWQGGSYQISFVPNSNTPSPQSYIWSGGNLQQNNLFKGTLSNIGVFTVVIPSNTSITPSGSQWQFTICPNATTGCVSVTQAVTGALTSLTAILSAAAVGPRFPITAGFGYGYGTVEVSPLPKPGSIFYNVTSGASPACNQWTGVAWSSCGGGGGSGSPGGAFNSVQYNNSGVFGGLPVNQFGALSSDGIGGVPTYVPPFAVSVMQAPYGAKCDGITDDHLAIQTALDNNAGVYIPTKSGGTTTCNIGTVGIQLCSSKNHFGFNALFGNGQILSYAGTGSAVTVEASCQVSWHVNDLQINLTVPSGTPTTITVNGAQNGSIEQVVDNPASITPGTYNSLNFVNDNTNAVKDSAFEGNVSMPTSQGDFFYSGSFQNLALGGDGNSFISTVWNGSNTQTFTGGNQWFGATGLNGPMAFTNAEVSFAGSSNSTSHVITNSGAVSLNGDLTFGVSGVPAISGSFIGTLSTKDSTGVPYFYQNGFLAPLQASVLYSAAGTPIFTCSASAKGVLAWVGDAASLSGAYTSGGTYQTPVYCGYNGTSYAWQTMGGSGGSSGVNSVSNLDGTETISPTTAAVIASVNQAHPFTWTANHTMQNSSVTWDVTSPSNPAVIVSNTGMTASSGTGQSVTVTSGGVAAGSGGSTSICWNTNGSTTACGGTGGVTQIVAGTGIGVSPGGGTGVVTVSSTQISTLPSNAVILCAVDSWCDDDPTGGVFQNAPTLTISSWTTSGSSPNFVATVTTTAAHNLNVGDWVNMRVATGFTSFLPANIALQTGVTLFQVLSGGFTTTQFEINTGTHNEGTCSSSCGTMETAMNNMPFKIAEQPGMPISLLNNVVVSIPNPVTVGGLASFFSTVTGPWNPATTGKPLYIIVNSPWNDIGICSSVSTIETAYASVFTQAHALTNTKVILPTIPANNISQQFGAGFCTYPAAPYVEADELQRYLNGSGRSAATAATGAYWDIYANSGASLNDPEYPNQGQGSATGWNLYASGIANALVSGNGAPAPLALERWGNASNADNTAGNGYNWHPSVDSVKTWQWQNAEYGTAMILGTATSGGAFQGLTVTGFGSFNTYDSTTPALRVSDALTPGTNTLATLFQSSLNTGDETIIDFGVAASANNSALWGFNYVGSGSASNNITLGVYGENGIKIDGAGNFYIPGIGSSPAPLCTTTGGQVTNSGCSGTGTTSNSLTMNNSGSGAASGTTFNGSAAQTISYNTVGAAAAPVNWTVETSSFSLAAGNGFIANASGGITASFPSSATTGFQSAICNVNTGTVTITSGTVTYVGPGTLAPTRCISFIYDGTDFRGTSQVAFSSGLTESDSGGIAAVAVTNPAVSGTGTYTTATSDAFTVTGATSSSHCVFSPTNSTAAATTVLGYVSSVAANLVTISHAATVASGGTVNIVCTVN